MDKKHFRQYIIEVHESPNNIVQCCKACQKLAKQEIKFLKMLIEKEK